MEKPRTVVELEEFLAIYTDVRRTTFEPYKEIRQRRLRHLPGLDRSIVKHTIAWLLGTLGLGVAAAAITLFICGSKPYGEVLAEFETIATQTVIAFLMWRLGKFKGSPSGEYKFYLEAKRLIEKFSKKGFAISSLRLALDRYISDMTSGFTVFAGIATALAVYLDIDENGFGGSQKVLRRIFSVLDPFDHGSLGRKGFLFIFVGCFLFAYGKFYLPRVWAEQVKRNLDHIIDREELLSAEQQRSRPSTNQ